MKKLFCIIILTSLLIGCNNTTTTSKDQIKARILKVIPEVGKIDQINQSPIKGMYEIVVGRKVFYVTNDGKYLIFGNVVDLDTKTSLTEQKMQQLSKIKWSDLPLNLAIKHVNGSGKKQIAVFADPDCPYCQLFEKQVVPSLTDTTIYTFLFPLPIHPNAKEDSIKVWCSSDRDKTWSNFMRNGIALPSKTDCDSSDLEKIYKVGTQVVEVDGTPTIILSNGQILSGVVPADQLIKQIDKALKE